MTDSYISTNLLGRPVMVDDDALRGRGGTLKHPHEGELVGIHRDGCSYTVLVLHDDGAVESYYLRQITIREES